ncbi:helix-turn-helix domain-containing protein [Tropicibacter sp. Alg240-R139]|uniref:winged helix-turn-helix transcriptional regulator n=1 Tax=Tropicibacter sp. Alg240-R139 TaxID=2305991 RepID=UPI0013E0E130|nr:helix-turn-helix domain-containing protein [Tropicibacter sp. Alg240-R139]
MTSSKPYGLLCPVSKACDLLGARWTLPILCEMWAGETRFNDIRRAVGGVSPTVLSRRLSEMEQSGLIARVEDRAQGTVDYVRTQKAIDLEPALMALGRWSQRNIEAEIALSYDVSTLMWAMRRLDTSAFPNRRIVIRFKFTESSGRHDTYWLLFRPGLPLEICVDVPGFDVDVFVETSEQSFAAVILGRSTIEREVGDGRLYLTGDAVMMRTLNEWFPRSGYADTDEILPTREPAYTEVS